MEKIVLGSFFYYLLLHEVQRYRIMISEQCAVRRTFLYISRCRIVKEGHHPC